VLTNGCNKIDKIPEVNKQGQIEKEKLSLRVLMGFIKEKSYSLYQQNNS
jgi:hypothetical protein